jgi:hypothetical protein
MTGDQLRKLALSLPDTSEAPHFDRIAFRTPKRIFATLAPDARTANVLLEPDQQAALVESHPDAFEAIAGGFGRQGWTTMTLAAVAVAEAKAVLADAHARASAAAPRPAKSKRATKRKR